MRNLEKKIRNAKIYFSSRKAWTNDNTNLKHVPQIRLEGNWLQKAGFAIGDNIEISAENGLMTIRAEGRAGA